MSPDTRMLSGDRLRRILPVVIGLGLFLAALEVLRVELRAVTWSGLMADLSGTPRTRLILAGVLTALNYASLTGYDFLAFASIGKRLPPRQIAVTSLLAYTISNNIGFSMLSGASVRYRFYSRWGVTAGELSRVVFSYTVTFWLGLLALGGLSLARGSLSGVRAIASPTLWLAAGWAFATLPLLYVGATLVRRSPIRAGRFEVSLPAPVIAIGQLAISAADWLLVATVLFVLLPAGAVAFVPFVGVFLVAILLGMLSHVPGGLGVFEGLMVLLLKPWLTSDQILPALVTFRAVYYLLPLSLALVALVADEVWRRRHHVVRGGTIAARMAEQLTPHVLALFVFLAGVVLLFSSATPAAPGRLALLDRLLPLGVIETSHFLGSVVGALLLVLSQGLARRLDAAYYVTAIAIVAGAASALLKGFDYEEATLLLVVLVSLWRARPEFDRRANFFDTRFSIGWTASLAGALGASIWLGLFAFKHVDYSNELWWRFELHGEASRFLRASVGAAIVLLLFGVARLLGYAPHETELPSDADLDAAAQAIQSQRATYPFLAYLRDKSLLFNDDRSGFVMYAVQGRTWVALGDPVGPETAISDLIRRFLERCDDYGGIPVFYEVRSTFLHLYADFGLTFLKMGEEARVDLSAFTLEGAAASRHRQALKRLEKEGASFRVVAPDAVEALLPQLREVSDDWLAAKSTAEKGFSLGFFGSDYVCRFPVAVIERAGRIVAFANLWPGPANEELSIDMMRFHRDAPKSIMESLLVHVMRWGREQGYRRFALGMAPLSGFEQSPAASLWNRLGAFLYEHGEAVYNFQGLRAYKEKFDPIWVPHYLAYHGGFRLPRIMADVSALVAGGYPQIFKK